MMKFSSASIMHEIYYIFLDTQIERNIFHEQNFKYDSGKNEYLILHVVGMKNYFISSLFKAHLCVRMCLFRIKFIHLIERNLSHFFLNLHVFGKFFISNNEFYVF